MFFKSLWEDSARPISRNSAASLPLSSTSIKSQTARVIYRRLKRVLYLQWRGILIVTIVLVDVIFFAVIFLYLDKLEASVLNNDTRIIPWVMCLVKSGGNRDACFALSRDWLVSEPTVGAMLIMISLLGIELFVLIFRWSLISGWKEKWTQNKGREFVSIDARKDPGSPNPPTFELRKIDGRLQIDYDRKNSGSSMGTDAESIQPHFYPNVRADSVPNSPAPAYSPRRHGEEDIFPSMSRPTASLVRNFSSPRIRPRDTIERSPSYTFASSGARHMTTPALPPINFRERSISPPGQAL